MKTRKRLILVLVAAIVATSSSFVYAACSGTICTGKIERLYMTGTTLYISTDGVETNLDCTPTSSVYITMPMNDPEFDRKYATLLTAMSLDATVGLRTPSSGACNLAYLYIDR